MGLEIVGEGVLSQRSGSRTIMPAITQLSDGSLIACQNVGTEFSSSDHILEVLASSDKGQSWSNFGNIIRDQNDLPWSYRGGHITELSDGRLAMAASRFEQSPGDLFDPDSEGLKRPEAVLFWSDDQGRSWSPPDIVPVDLPAERYTWNGSGRILELTDSRLMYPLETWKPDAYQGPPDQKAAAVFSNDGGKSWSDFTVIADDRSGHLTWWDQANTRLSDGRLYVMAWTHLYGTKEDQNVHIVLSEDEGKTWTTPQATNLRGQVCCPVGLPDGGVIAIYNYRHEPQGIRAAISQNLVEFDVQSELQLFDAKSEATLGTTNHDNFLAEHQLIGFGKPQACLLADGTVMACYWCTVDGLTHTRWARIKAE